MGRARKGVGDGIGDDAVFAHAIWALYVGHVTELSNADGDSPGWRPPNTLLSRCVREWGAYFGVATRTRNLGRWLRGGKSDLALLPALFVDIDDPDSALVHLAWFDLPPTSIVHSGRGYHAFWLLETPTTDFVSADQIIHGLAQHLGGDPALSVAQSMRLVGTLNTKPGRDNALCSLIRHFPERRYTLQDFACFRPAPVMHWYRPASTRHDPVPEASRQALIDAVTDAVMHHLDGRPRHNGFIAARCPLPHVHDRPGMHFSYSLETGWGFCFGKHGKINLREMCALLGVYNGNKVGYQNTLRL